MKITPISPKWKCIAVYKSSMPSRPVNNSAGVSNIIIAVQLQIMMVSINTLVCTLDSHIYSTNYIISNEEKIGVHFVCAAGNFLAQKKDVLLEDLLKYPFVLTEKGTSYRRLLDERLARYSLEIQPMLEIGRADLICRLVEEDTGISFLPDYVTEEAVREKRIVRLEVKEFKVELWKQLLYHRDKWMSFQMKVFLEHLGKIQLQ